MEKITNCRVCSSNNLKQILSLGNQALTGRFPLPGEPDPLYGPLELILCSECGLLQLSYNYELTDMYGPTYGYRSSLNQTMIDHLTNVAKKLKEISNFSIDDAILDIGSNDGTFLKMFQSRLRYGIDPSSAKFQHEYPSDVKLIIDFFTPDKLDRQDFKIISSIAMFYDIKKPLDFMRGVKTLLAKDGIWFSEQSHMIQMVGNLAYDSICHEHLCYYNLTQIIWMAKRAGLKIIDVETNKINGASFSFLAAHEDSKYETNEERISNLLQKENDFATSSTLINFRDRVSMHREEVLDFFDSHSDQLILGYGASTKGNVIIQYCNITKERMPAIAEKYAWKYGREVPKSRIPIISEEKAKEMKPDYFFVFPWHFRDEILQREMHYMQHGGKVIFPLPNIEVF